MRNTIGLILAGAAAGTINGLLGTGGGMVLIPLLTVLCSLEENVVFPTSVSIILPVCLVSLAVSAVSEDLPLHTALPWLAGSALGGISAGVWGRKIPVKWLHRGLGILIIWGGIRYLC